MLHWVREHWGSCSSESLAPASLGGRALQLWVFVVVMVEVKAVSLLECCAGHCSMWWWLCPQACSTSCCHRWLRVMWDNRDFLLQVVRGRRTGCCGSWTFCLTLNACSYEPLMICVVKFSLCVYICTLPRLVGHYSIEQSSAMPLSRLPFSWQNFSFFFCFLGKAQKKEKQSRYSEYWTLISNNHEVIRNFPSFDFSLFPGHQGSPNVYVVFESTPSLWSLSGRAKRCVSSWAFSAADHNSSFIRKAVEGLAWIDW